MDDLIGLKENVIIGKLIPAGTGMNLYKNTRISTEESDDAEVVEESEVTETVEEAQDAETVQA